MTTLKFKRYHLGKDNQVLKISFWGYINGIDFISPDERFLCTKTIDCQFIGMLDKLKNEIYEGDISRETNPIKKGLIFEDEITYLVVVWIQEICTFSFISVMDYANMIDDGFESLDDCGVLWNIDQMEADMSQIIGNMYQNSEYLERF